MHLMRSFVSAVTATTAPRRMEYGVPLTKHIEIDQFSVVYSISIRHLSFIVFYC